MSGLYVLLVHSEPRLLNSKRKDMGLVSRWHERGRTGRGWEQHRLPSYSIDLLGTHCGEATPAPFASLGSVNWDIGTLEVVDPGRTQRSFARQRAGTGSCGSKQ